MIRIQLVKIPLKVLFIVLVLSLKPLSTYAQNNLALSGKSISSNPHVPSKSDYTIDGKTDTGWMSEGGKEPKWVLVTLPGATEVVTVVLHLEDANGRTVSSYALQTFMNGFWNDLKKVMDNHEKIISIDFKNPVLTDRIRLVIYNEAVVKVNEFEIYGRKYVSNEATPVRKIITNQSGYNLDKPKRFTAPEILDNTAFIIKNTRTNKEEYRGTVMSHIGDFTNFNPSSSDEYEIVIGANTSFPFRIGPYWLERVTYRNMIDFMIGARHYLGTTDKIRQLSWAWRDGDFFNWSMQTLVAQYLSNPEAYKRMKQKISYKDNTSFPLEYKDKWGRLEPYKKDAPDIVKLIHWDADVKISQELNHEMQKAELAHFLYAFPYLKEWLPQQNFDVVYKYVIDNWENVLVTNGSTKYDQSPEHNLLALKTKMGTNKGELPPGHSVIPNLMMFKVAKKQGEKDAIKYFNAAFNQMEWMIANLDWNDPLTTKGQRMSEHITLRSFAFFYNQYPKKAPQGLMEKVEEWGKVMVGRSKNMWDFRKYTDHGDWVPNGWNETGNILSFPASAIAAMSIITNKELKQELDKITWSHIDNAFGRNPTGRHFSYDGPSEIEGVDLGWYSFHHGGVGLLEEVPFVFDGSPKNNHYPNHPEIGNIGWTEGWVQHNTAFNVSMAYLANYETEIILKKRNKKTIEIRLKAPLNFDENKVDMVDVFLKSSRGDVEIVKLREESPFSKYLLGTVAVKKGKIKLKDGVLQLKNEDIIEATYGFGYFEKRASIKIGNH
ncbi:discoidin domain-containing protein [Cellulophaga sp. F20128]|uniref:discoidin domain-containing protein n=1 Tax=Cellulophaga sp. F20128 TaxID=2926413 RepID=UPI001FF61BC8|nr:discoidin domain-containing protein [Cellulophaga sp. F20128]MCK0158298.1 discoidin domain-containing protein [Cellulophaga sp. F20128]